ncbi:MAG: DNA translocase FtsK [Spirochaetaceae bacterium]|nr:MAG: DNA translocase FtsK [Spirochaetaceae bacterium]
MIQQRSTTLVVSSILVATGMVLLASCITHVLGFGSRSFFLLILELPGQFLYHSFHAAGFFVPLFFLAAGVLVTRPAVAASSVLYLNAAVLPFLSLSLSLRLFFGANIERSLGTRVIAQRMTALGGAIALFALSLVLVGLIRRLGLWFERSAERRATRVKALIADTRAETIHADSDVEDDVDGELESAEVDWTAMPVSQMVADSIAAVQQQTTSAHGTELEQDLEQDTEVWTGFVHQGERSVGPDDDDDALIDDADLLEEDAGWAADSDEMSVLSLRFVGGRFEDSFEPLEPAEERVDQPLQSDNAGGETGRRAPRRRGGRYYVPIDGILDKYADVGYWVIDDETRAAAELLRVTLEEFQIAAEVTGIRKGPVITMFEILPAPGVKLAKITNLADNIALRLAAQSVRIVAPIPGKHAVGIEIPNRNRNIVSFSELLQEERFKNPKMTIPIALGKDIPGDAQIVDLTRTPHLLIAGATGSGKSVCVNSIICSILYRRSPREVKMMLIDPKIVELKFYNDIPHLLTPVITDPKRAFQALQWCIYEMERRYSLLDSLAVRDVRSYNAKVEKRSLATEPLPYIVVVIDEFADLMQTSGKELESTLARLAAMSRAVGIHLVLATQRPSTDVITGLIKANIPSRIAFMVSSKVDSRIILDAQGAEKLLGQGDMLFTSAWDPFPSRMQGAFLSEEEVERIVEHVKTLGEPEYIDDEIFLDEDDEDFVRDELEDPLMEKAIEIVVTAKKASASYLQRRLKIGYNRAARLVEEMERIGIVGPQNGSKPRDIISAPH